MFCPECGAEYREGFDQCSDCHISLVREAPSTAKPIGPAQLVTVLTTGDPSLIAFAKSILEDASIQYLAKGEGLQDILALGRLGTGYNLIAGPVEFQVDREDEADARALFAEMDKSSGQTFDVRFHKSRAEAWERLGDHKKSEEDLKRAKP